MTIVLLAFATTFAAELPDKTALATLVLATRYRARDVWLGAAGAFLVHKVIAVAAGSQLARIPDGVTRPASAALFALFALLMLRRALAGDDDADAEQIGAAVAGPRARSGITAAFVGVFVAEWGDLTQLATITLVARYDAPLQVFVGALAGVWLVAAIATLVGRRIGDRLPERAVAFGAAGVLAVLAVVILVV